MRSGSVTLMPSLLITNTSASFLARAALPLPALGLLMAWCDWFSTFEGQAVDQSPESSGSSLKLDRMRLIGELAAQVFQGDVVGRFGVLELLELAHQLVGLVVVEVVVGLADRRRAVRGSDRFHWMDVKRVQHHLTDDLGG